MNKKGKLLRSIIPLGQGKEIRYYPKGAIVEFDRRGIHVEPYILPIDPDIVGRPLAGWLVDNLSTRKVNFTLIENIDFEVH